MMINRASIILRHKEPAVTWINEADPYEEDPGRTIDNVNTDRTVYLVREEDAHSPDSVRVWIEHNYDPLFESELSGWYTDEELWPADKTIELFDNWFSVECNSVIVDTVEGAIYDEEI